MNEKEIKELCEICGQIHLSYDGKYFWLRFSTPFESHSICDKDLKSLFGRALAISQVERDHLKRLQKEGDIYARNT